MERILFHARVNQYFLVISAAGIATGRKTKAKSIDR